MSRVFKPYLLSAICFIIMTCQAYGQISLSATAGTTSGTYSNLVGAFNAINAGTHQGIITMIITSDLGTSVTTGTAVLNESGSGSASYTGITIRPSGARSIIGNIFLPILLFNGADNVTIDGLNTGGNSLTIQNNTSGSNGAILLLHSGASDNTIKNCSLLASPAGYGVITMSNTDFNDNDSISGCTIGPGPSGRPQYGIVALGSGTTSNWSSDNLVIYNNNIYNYNCPSAGGNAMGIYVGPTNNNAKIYNNRFYQTASLTLNVASNHFGIYYSNTAGAVDIRNNTFGGNNSSGTGTYTLDGTGGAVNLYPIYVVACLSTTVSNIQNNTIKNISLITASTTAEIFTPIKMAAGKANIGDIAGNNIGTSTGTGSITITSVTATGATQYIYGIHYAGTFTGKMENNKVGGINFNYTGGATSYKLNFFAIYNSGVVSSIYNNMVGSDTIPNSIRIGPSSGTLASDVRFQGIFNNYTNDVTINNNVVANVWVNADGSTVATNTTVGIAAWQGGQFIVQNNIVKNISSNSTNTSAAYYGTGNTVALAGILVISDNVDNIISANTVSGLRTTDTGAATSLVGIGCALYGSGGGSYQIYSNKVIDLGSNSNNSAATARGIDSYYGGHASGGSIYNNFICFNNSLTSIVVGIDVFYCTSYYNVYYNTVYIEGSNSFTGESVCFRRYYANIYLYNNLLFNKRTSSGRNLAVTSLTYSTFTTGNPYFYLNYNLYVVPDTAYVINVAGTVRGWGYYSGITNTSDKWSFADRSANIVNTSLFNSPSTGDLTINTGNLVCWYVSGKGMPLSGYSTDHGSTTTRSTSVSAGATDIGADEFSTSTSPFRAVASGTFAAGGRSTYTLLGRVVATIDWAAGSTLPSSAPVIKYFTGVDPLYPISGKQYFNCYWDVAPPSTPSGMSYKITLYYSPAQLGTASESGLRMAKNSGSSSAGWGCQCNSSGAGSTTVNTTTKTFSNTTNFNSFSIFTGTDNAAPLPVEMLSFTALRIEQDVLLQWSTASEINNSHFAVERSIDGLEWESLDEVPGSGTTPVLSKYAYTDYGAFRKTAASLIYYRLRQVDLDGLYAYSDVAVAGQDGTAPSVSIGPNPFVRSLSLQLRGVSDKFLQVEVVDAFGREIWSGRLETGNGNGSVAIPGAESWGQGTYYVKATANLTSFSDKIIKF